MGHRPVPLFLYPQITQITQISIEQLADHVNRV
jgi:hypothetical protein